MVGGHGGQNNPKIWKFVPYDPVPYDQGDLFGLLICLYQVNRIKHGLTIYIHLWTNNDSEKVSPITLVKTSLKIARVPYDPLQNFFQNGHFVPYDPLPLYYKLYICNYK